MCVFQKLIRSYFEKFSISFKFSSVFLLYVLIAFSKLIEYMRMIGENNESIEMIEKAFTNMITEDKLS